MFISLLNVKCSMCFYISWLHLFWAKKNKKKVSGAPGGWSAPLAWGTAVEEDASPPTQPHPGTLHHPPLLQTFKNGEGNRRRIIKKKQSVYMCVCACVCVGDR